MIPSASGWSSTSIGTVLARATPPLGWVRLGTQRLLGAEAKEDVMGFTPSVKAAGGTGGPRTKRARARRAALAAGRGGGGRGSSRKKKDGETTRPR